MFCGLFVFLNLNHKAKNQFKKTPQYDGDSVIYQHVTVTKHNRKPKKKKKKNIKAQLASGLRSNLQLFRGEQKQEQNSAESSLGGRAKCNTIPILIAFDASVPTYTAVITTISRSNANRIRSTDVPV